MIRVHAGSRYQYQPVGLDLFDACTDLQPGEIVEVVNLPGCPRANIMKHCHVKRLDGSFAGLVLTASLEPQLTRRNRP